MNKDEIEEIRRSRLLYLGFGIAIFSLFFSGNNSITIFTILVSIFILVANIFRVQSSSAYVREEIHKLQIFLIIISLFLVTFELLIPDIKVLYRISNFKLPPGATYGSANHYDNNSKVFAIINVIISSLSIIGLIISIFGLKEDKQVYEKEI